MQQPRRGDGPRLSRAWNVGVGFTGILALLACTPPMRSVGVTPADADLPPDPPEGGERGSHPGAKGAQSTAGDAQTSSDGSDHLERAGTQEAPGLQGCPGEVPASLRAWVAERSQEAADCLGGISVQGRVELRYSVQVEADGRVSALTLLTDTLRDPSTQECVEAVLQTPFEKGPKGGCAIFVVPLEALEEPGSQNLNEEEWEANDVSPAEDQ